MPLYVDEGGRKRWTRIVYVIDLQPDACPARGYCSTECERLTVYVGESALEPEERLAQHLAGIKSSKWVRRYGIDVNAALTDRQEYASVAESQAAERALSEELAANGYCVFGGH
jgi:hypothetical protein